MTHFFISPSLKPVSVEFGVLAAVAALADDPVVPEEGKKQTHARKNSWTLSTLQVTGLYNCHNVIYFKNQPVKKPKDSIL